MKKRLRKILIIRFSSIGDIVLTTPVVRTLKKQLNAEIHFLTKKSYQSILSANPYIDKIHLLKDKLSQLLPQLKNEKYDLIVDLHKNLRSKRVVMALGQKTVSFDKINIQKWFIVNFKWNRLPKKHIVDRYFDGLQVMGIKNDGDGLDYFFHENDSVDIGKEYGIFDGRYIAFAIGGTYTTKKMPVKKIIEIVNEIKIPVVLLGGKEDYNAGEAILQAKNNKVYNACGKWNLNQSASIVEQAALVITHDTGMMHIAAAFNKKIISIWGNTIPEFGMYPYLPSDKGESKIIEVGGLSCRPCSKIGFDICPKGHFKCMEMIDVEEITRYVQNRTI